MATAERRAELYGLVGGRSEVRSRSIAELQVSAEEAVAA